MPFTTFIHIGNVEQLNIILFSLKIFSLMFTLCYWCGTKGFQKCFNWEELKLIQLSSQFLRTVRNWEEFGVCRWTLPNDMAEIGDGPRHNTRNILQCCWLLTNTWFYWTGLPPTPTPGFSRTTLGWVGTFGTWAAVTGAAETRHK